MKQISLITVNNPGLEAAEKTVRDLLSINQDFEIKIYHKNRHKNRDSKVKNTADYIEYSEIDEILDNVWKNNDAIIWFTATGIVVRKIAPFLKSKTIDPAVLVMNLSRTQVIPLLSGHLGGANDLAQKLTKINPDLISFITTATDSLNVFAFDNFAQKAGFDIINIEELAKISNSLINNLPVNLITYPEIFEYLKEEGLDETKIRFYHFQEFENVIKLTGKELGEYKEIKELRKLAIDYYKKNIQGKTTEHQSLGEIKNKEFGSFDRQIVPGATEPNNNITDNVENFNPYYSTVVLSPFAHFDFKNAFKIRIKPVVLGIGLNRGTPLEELEADIADFLEENGLSLENVKNIASFDAKKDEEALKLFSEKNKIKLAFFGKDEINRLNEDFSKSRAQEFFNIKGVAEPTAVLAAPFRTLFVKKKIYRNITIAAAL